jgi:DNA-binding IclR family transcriptional regulator
VLRALAPSEAGLTADALVQRTGIDRLAVEAALETLARHDVVAEEDGRWRFTVELMRRWVLRREKEKGEEKR